MIPAVAARPDAGVEDPDELEARGHELLALAARARLARRTAATMQDAWIALPPRSIVEPYGVTGRVLADGLRKAGLPIVEGRPSRARRSDIEKMLAARAVVRPLKTAANDAELDEFERVARGA